MIDLLFISFLSIVIVIVQFQRTSNSMKRKSKMRLKQNLLKQS